MSSATHEDNALLFTFYNPGTSSQYSIKVLKVSQTEYILFYNGLHSEKVQGKSLAEDKITYSMNTLSTQFQRLKIDMWSPYPTVDFSFTDFREFVQKRQMSIPFYVGMLG